MKQIKYSIRVLAAVLVLMILSPTALAAFKANVYAPTMNVYSENSTTSSKIGELSKGDEVSVKSFSGEWAKITYKEFSGYAQIKFLKSQKRAKAYLKANAIVYSTASTSSKKIATLAIGKRLYLVGKNGSFFLIENKAGTQVGYVEKQYISKKKPTLGTDVKYSTTMPSKLKSTRTKYSDSLSNSEKIEYMVYVAQNQLGDPYSTSPSEPSSFDSGSFTKYCFGKAGVTLKSGTYGQGYDSSYSKISKITALKRGDIVCFNTNKSDSDASDETGIYIGSGYFVHASPIAGMVVVASLTTSYYKSAFSWGLRIFD